MPGNVLIEPANTIWRNTTIKEKCLKGEYFDAHPEYAKLINAQLAGTWRPEGMRPREPVANMSDGFMNPIAGYGGHTATFRRDAELKKEATLAEKLGEMPNFEVNRGMPMEVSARENRRAASSRDRSGPASTTPSMRRKIERYEAQLARNASAPAFACPQATPQVVQVRATPQTSEFCPQRLGQRPVAAHDNVMVAHRRKEPPAKLAALLDQSGGSSHWGRLQAANSAGEKLSPRRGELGTPVSRSLLGPTWK